MDAHVALLVADPSHAGEARRLATALAGRIGLDQTDSGRAALVVTEAATNIVKHAGQGYILVRPLREEYDRPGIEVLALDRGPGMSNLARCLQDGYSTAGSPGTGLGAISRLASMLDIYTGPSQGTALLAHVLPQGATPSSGPLAVGAVRVAAPGEIECGDDWSLQQLPGRAILLVADGLGHGGDAARAAAQAIRIFGQNASLPVDQILELAHRALLATRGAAVSVAELDVAGGQLRFAGVGNVTCLMAWSGGSRTIIPQNGTAGGHLGHVRLLSFPWVSGATLIAYTDGLKSHVSVDSYPGLLMRHPSLVAGVLYRDFVRGRDDATVVVTQQRRAGT